MNNYEIVIDSSCDLTLELRKRFFIYEDYIRCIVYIPGGEIKADLDWNNIPSSDFYKIVKSKVGQVKTAFATYEEFVRVIEPILKNKQDVMIFTISSGLSGSSNAYNNYKEMLLEDYPDRKIEVIDTLKYSCAGGLLAIECAKNRNDGMTIEENTKWVNEKRFCLREMGILDDLRFLAKNGRIAASKAFFGTLVGVQPLADFTVDGKTMPLGTVKGAKKADKFSIEYLMKTAVDIEDQIVFIAHSEREERAKIFKEQLLKVAKPKDVIIANVGQCCGPNIGPGICTYFYFGSKISENHEIENKLFKEICETL